MPKQVAFPGYKYEKGVSTYKGHQVGEGGYVYSEPGVYQNVALLDIASMHPTTIEELNLFGKYTDRFSEIKATRLCIKHWLNADYQQSEAERAGDTDKVRELEDTKKDLIKKVSGYLDGSMVPYLKTENANGEFQALSDSLKIVINSVYGYTSAKFDNPFRDIRNVDNIVAKRGALFMVDLMQFVQEAGYNVAHIKTDSIKIPDADEDIIKKVFDFGKEYGYDFEHETTYRVMALVNDAVYIAEDYNKKKDLSYWSATGAMFQHPYVFNKLFHTKGFELEDLYEARSVKAGYMYMIEEDDETKRHFLGKTGLFLPVKPGRKGGKLVRVQDDKDYAVANTSGWLWRESHLVEYIDDVDFSYYDLLKEKALNAINAVGSYTDLIEASSLPQPEEYLFPSPAKS